MIRALAAFLITVWAANAQPKRIVILKVDGLNQDLLVVGVLFHDCGKLWENNYGEASFTMPYSLHGEMVGHIALGMELVNKLWRQLMETEGAKSWAILDPANELVRVHLLHLIGSHSDPPSLASHQ